MSLGPSFPTNTNIIRKMYTVNLKRRKEADRISLNGGQPET